MGGEIEILDKEYGERGTCFRFNVFFIVCGDDSALSIDASKRVHVDSEDHYLISGDLYPSSGCSTFAPSPKAQSSLVVMLIRNNERRKMVRKYMCNRGVRVVILKEASKFCRVLRKIKARLVSSQVSSSGLSDLSPHSWLSSGGSSFGMAANKNLPLNTMDGLHDDVLPPVHGRRTNIRGPITCVLTVIDTSAGDFSELCKSVAEFRKDICGTTTCCKVVWLEKPETKKLHLRGLGQENLAPTDLVITKPLHGSRLFQIIGLLPEYGGQSGGRVSTRWNRDNTEDTGSAADPSSKLKSRNTTAASRDPPPTIRSRWHGEIEELSSSSNDMPLKRWSSIASRNAFQQDEAPEFGSSSSEKYSASRKSGAVQPKKGERWANQKSTTIQRGKAEELGSSCSGKILDGKRILIVDDNHVLGMVSEAFVSQLGASVLLSHSGEEAVTLVSKGLQEQTVPGAAELPFDYILMDCEMPGMDGFEATKMIRKEEEKYGVHIPIIALTAHTADEKGKRIIEAGMDFHLTKPLQQSQLVDYIRENEKL
ncbi:hypothetical protein Ancab_022492 [Ancistrocladus abbreviatus]